MEFIDALCEYSFSKEVGWELVYDGLKRLGVLATLVILKC